ncbi:DUF4232 domain-containing protein [Streptomyces sp. 15-116A]|uniref:DUF4232 domain-containing protein n=1 Tax=Streptomyces sp. 15-116A TaxID=2259035 RepID=UPI0021B399D9|nr:DUF4232 domain-containing protein [Streptomyces sp. 15-116A]MCT7356691.1 DUF4232 domain-containing protein [Streptomyces sp. 15-116A]
MRAVPIAVTALSALLLLTACDDGKGEDGKSAQRQKAACAIDEVSMEVGPASVAPAAGDTGDVPVSFTNQSAECTLDGFPEVFLTRAGDSERYEVPPAEGAKAQKLTLAKGESASFTLTYVRGERAVDVKRLHVVFPSEGGDPSTREYRWSYGPIAGGDGDGLEVSVSAYQKAGD